MPQLHDTPAPVESAGSPVVPETRLEDHNGVVQPPVGLSIVLDEAYMEYWQLQQRGEAIDPHAFCVRYPEIYRALAHRLSIHRYLEDNTHLLKAGPVRWPEAGEEFFGFRLERLLGLGAFSRVFLAHQTALGGRRVALKLTCRGGGEAHTLGRLAHPNIVPVFSVEPAPGTGLTALCMPYLGDATLLNLLDRIGPARSAPRDVGIILEVASRATGELPEKLSPPALVLSKGSYIDGVRHLAAQMLDALAYLHEQGVIHRDLKPSNVLLTPDGVPMLLDFNLSADAERDEAELGGTPAYMAPEQLRAMGAGPAVETIGARADLFALGVIFYELLTGTHPFGSISLSAAPEELCRQILERQPAGVRPVRELNRAVDHRFAAVVERCLAFAPEKRPATAREAAAALQSRRGFARAWERVPRRPRFFVTLGLSAFLAVTALVLTLRSTVGPTDLERGLTAYRQGQYEHATLYLGQAIEREPDSARGWFARGLAFQRLGVSDRRNFAHAAADFEAAESLDPQGKTKAWLGYCAHRQGYRNTAAVLYDEALQAGYQTAEVLNNLGAAELDLARAASAETHLGRALALAPLGTAYHNRALAYLHLARLAAPAGSAAAPGRRPSREALLHKAIADTRMALEVGTPSGELYYDAAQCCAVAARTDRKWADPALKYLDLALRHGVEPKKLADAVWSAVRLEVRFREMQGRSHIPHPALKATRILPPADE